VENFGDELFFLFGIIRLLERTQKTGSVNLFKYPKQLDMQKETFTTFVRVYLGGQKLMTETVAVKKSTFHILIAGFVVVLLVASFLAGYSIGSSGRITGGVTGSSVAGGSLAVPTPSTAPPSKLQVSADDDPVKGDPKAAVTIIEFSDFQCPFCGRFFQQTLPQVENDYIKTGKAKLVYRDFPLDSIHPQAGPAAQAAECAKEQGKFWEYHDKIFQNQQSLGTDSYKQWAGELGLNANQFNSCVDSSKYAAEVSKDFQDGSNAGVSGTPTFFIGNDAKGYQQIVGAQPYSVIKQVLDQALAG